MGVQEMIQYVKLCIIKASECGYHARYAYNPKILSTEIKEELCIMQNCVNLLGTNLRVFKRRAVFPDAKAECYAYYRLLENISKKMPRPSSFIYGLPEMPDR